MLAGQTPETRLCCDRFAVRTQLVGDSHKAPLTKLALGLGVVCAAAGFVPFLSAVCLSQACCGLT